MNELEKLIEEARSRTLEILKFDKNEEDKGLAIHRESIVIDSLTGGVMPFSKRMIERANERVKAGNIHEINTEMEKIGAVDIVEDPQTRDEYIKVWRKSGVTCISKTLASRHTLPEAIRRLSSSKYRIDRLRDVELLATCANDIKQAKKEGKHAIIWNFQNTLPIGGGNNVDKELDNIDLLYSLGLRVMQLTYNLRNFVGDGCTERYQSGLTYFGIRVVERMNKLGIMVDTSHSGFQTTMDAINVSKLPIAATHTTCKSVYRHNRGKTDEELKAIAEKGGYIGILMIPAFIGGKGTIKEFLDHINYVVELIGAKNVGIGTDTRYRSHYPQTLIELTRRSGMDMRYPSEKKITFSGRAWWSGWRLGVPEADFTPSPEMKPEETQTGSLAWINWPYITVGLVNQGYSDQEIKGILGGNFLNLIEKTIG